MNKDKRNKKEEGRKKMKMKFTETDKDIIINY
jgi:hypothetical protein